MQPGGEVSANVLVEQTPYYLRNRQTNQLAFQNPLRFCGRDGNPPHFPTFNLAPDGQIACLPFNPNEFIFLAAVPAANPVGGARGKRKGSRKSKKRSRKNRRNY